MSRDFWQVIRTDIPGRPVMATMIQDQGEAVQAFDRIAEHWRHLGVDMELDIVLVTAAAQDQAREALLERSTSRRGRASNGPGVRRPMPSPTSLESRSA